MLPLAHAPQPLKMHFWRSPVAMVRPNADWVECQGFVDTRRHLGGSAIENRRRKSRSQRVAGEKVAAEKKSQLSTIESAMSYRVTGKMNRLEPVPNVEQIAILEPSIDRERPIPQDRSPQRFERAADARHAGIRIGPAIVRLVPARRRHPRRSLGGQRSHIENVIEMAVGDHDASNRFPIPAAPAQGAPEQDAPADESAVDHVEAVGSTQDIEIQRRRAHLKQIVTKERHRWGESRILQHSANGGGRMSSLNPMTAPLPPANPMGFWTPNIDKRGRIARAVTGLILVAAGAFAWRAELQIPGLICGGAGLFCFYEAMRGWCVIRACKMRTPR